MRKFCLQILKLDNSLRFAGVLTTDGRFLAAEHRLGLTNILLTPEEFQLAAMQSLIRLNMRMTMQEKLGRPILSITGYEKVFGATMLIEENESKSIEESALMVSIDKDCPDPWSLAVKRILPVVKRTFS